MQSMTWNVKALKMGTLTVEKSTLVYCQSYGEKIRIPIWAVAIWGNGHKILVDTGIAIASAALLLAGSAKRRQLGKACGITMLGCYGVYFLYLCFC